MENRQRYAPGRVDPMDKEDLKGQKYQMQQKQRTMKRKASSVDGGMVSSGQRGPNVSESQTNSSKKRSQHVVNKETQPVVNILPSSNHSGERSSVHFQKVIMDAYLKEPSVEINQEHQQGLEALGNFIIIENESDNPITILCNSTLKNARKIAFQRSKLPGGDVRVDVFISRCCVGVGIGRNAKEAKNVAAQNVLRSMKSMFPVVKVKLCRYEKAMECESKISLEDAAKGGPGPSCVQKTLNDMNESIPENNMGHRLLQKMGWTGGGLGRDGNGIVDPVDVQMRGRRTGLGMDLTPFQDEKGGLEMSKINSGTIRSLLHQVKCGDRDQLVFSSKLSKFDREKIHKLCAPLGLTSTSYGKGSDRFITVSHKKTLQEIYYEALNGSNEYSVEMPPQLDSV